MKKNVVQDVIPGKKSIRNVELSSRPKKFLDRESENTVVEKAEKPKSKIQIKKTIAPKEYTEEVGESVVNDSYNYTDDTKKKSKKGLYFASAVFLVALFFGVSSMFKNAKITLAPKQEIKAMNETFSAKKDLTAVGLGYQVVTTTKDMEKTVEATGEERVDKKARGRIIIYNNTTAPQKLVATTRFETPEGLVFRAINPVTVPARVVKDGKTVAGSIEALVEADKAGAGYNIGLKDFTVPGLKRDAKYSQIYGRSKTEMTGGFSGMQKVVPKEIVATVDAQLEEELKASLSKDITTQIPANFVLYKDTLAFSFEPAVQVSNSTGNAVLKKRGVVSAVIFDKGSLSKVIIAKLLPPDAGGVVKIINLEDLSFNYIPGVSFDIDTATNITFTLKGEPNFVWTFDENKLKSDLLGLSKKNAKIVIGTYGTIKEAWVETYPFWNGTIPSDPNKVSIINTSTR